MDTGPRRVDVWSSALMMMLRYRICVNFGSQTDRRTKAKRSWMLEALHLASAHLKHVLYDRAPAAPRVLTYSVQRPYLQDHIRFRSAPASRQRDGRLRDQCIIMSSSCVTFWETALDMQESTALFSTVSSAWERQPQRAVSGSGLTRGPAPRAPRATCRSRGGRTTRKKER